MYIEQWAEPDEELSGSYELLGCYCTRPSGNAEEWLEIAKHLRLCKSISFRRVAILCEDRSCQISCPRNAYDNGDYDVVSDRIALADQIEQTLKESGEVSYFGYDPIKLGC
jgi:hypothetical protein